ncbi:hypothetical protein AAJ76_2000058386 [Vairimorpha ceranae]|uniref:Uncharacterized protein n=1 Tax=Vairimorpha ceranae TaxID=40302 RepID=A0A0F9WFH9_9MICR|nr:hypothetical protein AAJ76_2000058386 [Vairimorpha ceranae]KKO75485.1 hypothetical protein AAJ76_2000058386 [Vairimorpha ceranae]
MLGCNYFQIYHFLNISAVEIAKYKSLLINVVGMYLKQGQLLVVVLVPLSKWMKMCFHGVGL